MKTKIKTILTTNNIKINNNVDAFVFFDESTNHIIALRVNDFKKGNYNNVAVINKTSELAELGRVQLVNIKEFMSKFPSSRIDKYIASSKHSERVFYNFDLYVSAYIHLYRLYKSFETIIDNGLIGFIDTFIDNCISENTDHPGTISYYNYSIHNVLKLRKAVFELFKNYINNYNNYLYIYNNQHIYKYTDTQFRAVAKTLKVFSKSQTVVKKSFLETFAEIHNNETA